MIKFEIKYDDFKINHLDDIKMKFYDVKIIDYDKKNTLESYLVHYINSNLNDEKRRTLESYLTDYLADCLNNIFSNSKRRTALDLHIDNAEEDIIEATSSLVSVLIEFDLAELKDRNNEDYNKMNKKLISDYGLDLNEYTDEEIDSIFYSMEKSWNKTKKRHLISKL